MHDIFWLLQSGCNLVSVPKGPQDWMCGILNHQAAMASSIIPKLPRHPQSYPSCHARHCLWKLPQPLLPPLPPCLNAEPPSSVNSRPTQPLQRPVATSFTRRTAVRLHTELAEPAATCCVSILLPAASRPTCGEGGTCRCSCCSVGSVGGSSHDELSSAGRSRTCRQGGIGDQRPAFAFVMVG